MCGCPKASLVEEKDLMEEKQSAQANRLPTIGHVSESILGDPEPARSLADQDP